MSKENVEHLSAETKSIEADQDLRRKLTGRNQKKIVKIYDEVEKGKPLTKSNLLRFMEDWPNRQKLRADKISKQSIHEFMKKLANELGEPLNCPPMGKTTSTRMVVDEILASNNWSLKEAREYCKNHSATIAHQVNRKPKNMSDFLSKYFHKKGMPFRSYNRKEEGERMPPSEKTGKRKKLKVQSTVAVCDASKSVAPTVMENQVSTLPVQPNLLTKVGSPSFYVNVLRRRQEQYLQALAEITNKPTMPTI